MTQWIPYLLLGVAAPPIAVWRVERLRRLRNPNPWDTDWWRPTHDPAHRAQHRA